MKIRIGFVSNSSSSSFAILGVQIDTDELLEKLNIDSEEDNDWTETIRNKTGLHPEVFWDDDTTVIGEYLWGADDSFLSKRDPKEWTNITPELLKELQSILDKFGIEDKIKIYSHCGRD